MRFRASDLLPSFSFIDVWHVRQIALAVLLAASAVPPQSHATQDSRDSAFLGSETCRDCHKQEHEAWLGSHHQLAMQKPTANTVLGDFNNASFSQNGVTTTFKKQGERFIVNTDGEDGKLQDFDVAYVFGVYPLQQYLLPLSRGRLQALTIAWDARPQQEGGQRWYSLYPETVIDHNDPLHWTGPYLNWNSHCAECHSTDVKKRYQASTRHYDTQYEEISVGCEACHGPGNQHVALAKAGKITQAQNTESHRDVGLQTQLARVGQWSATQGATTAQRIDTQETSKQIDTCARCHARRSTLGDYHYGADFLTTHSPSVLQTPLYFPDGQIKDEVYVYGSFLQSKMHQAGVECSDCHEPHSLQLRAPGNALCAQCHAPTHFDTPKHHHHPEGTSGAQCVNCHMSERLYMGVDPRRDHSLRIPRPDLSAVIDTPNACNDCHREQSAIWALQAMRKWGVQLSPTSEHPGRLFSQMNSGDSRAAPKLAAIANHPQATPIWRATAIESLGQAGSPLTLESAKKLLRHKDPMLRTSAVRALDVLPPSQRLHYLRPLLQDNISAVRMALAESLAPLELGHQDATTSSALRQLFDDYLSILNQHADMPGVQMQLGGFYAARGEHQLAKAAYREALHIDPRHVPAYLNLADLQRALGNETKAKENLLQALAIAPNHGSTLHALGLLEARLQHSAAALDYLSKAAATETHGIRHRFVYAIALHDLGEVDTAIEELQDLLRSVPHDHQVLVALCNYLRESGRVQEALPYAKTLMEVAPHNRHYQQLYQQLQRR